MNRLTPVLVVRSAMSIAISIALTSGCFQNAGTLAVSVESDGSSMLCAGGSAGTTMRLRLDHPGWMIGPSGRREMPAVVLRSDAASYAGQVTEAEEGALLVVAFGEALSVGSYDVVITRAFDQASHTIPQAVSVVEAPVVLGVTGGAVCDSTGSDLVLEVRGSGFSSDVLVRLSDGGDVLASELVDATLLLVQVPRGALELVAGKEYELVVNRGSCVVRKARAIEILSDPEIASVVAGPKLYGKEGVAADAAVRFRLLGKDLAPGGVVRVAGFEADTVTAPVGAALGVLEASFGAGALPSGEVSVEYQAVGCPVAAAPGRVTLVGNAHTVTRLSPDAAEQGTVAGAVFDVFGEFSGQLVEVFVSGNADPLAADRQWRQATPFVALAAGHRGERFLLPPNLQPSASAGVIAGAGAQDVVLVTERGTPSEAQHYMQGGLSVVSGAVPLLRYQDQGSGKAGDVVSLWGCELSATDTYELVSEATGLASSSSSVSSSADPWGPGFVCRQGVAASAVRIDVAVPSVAPGVYRWRVSRAALPSRHTALYPFVVYGDTVSLSQPSDAAQPGFEVLPGVTLSAGRKNPAAVVAADRLGRRYLYVMGGDSSSTTSVNPVAVGTFNSTYEYTPLGPDNELVGMVVNSGSGDSTFELGLGYNDASAALADCGNYTLATTVEPTYGASALADGINVYWLFGTQTAESAKPGCARTSRYLRHATVTDPFLAGPPGRLTGFTAVPDSVDLGARVFGSQATLLRSGNARRIVAFGGYQYVPAGTSHALGANLVAVDLGAGADPTGGLAGAVIPTLSVSGTPREQAFGATLFERDGTLVAFGGLSPILGTVGVNYHRLQRFAPGLTSVAAAEVAGLRTVTSGPNTIHMPEAGFGVFEVAGSRWLLGGGVPTFADGPTLNEFDDETEIFWDGGFSLEPPVSRAARQIAIPASASDASVTTSPAKLRMRTAAAGVVFAAPRVYVLSGIVCSGDDLADLDAMTAGELGTSCDNGIERVLTPRLQYAVVR